MKLSIIEDCQDSQNAKRKLRTRIISTYTGLTRAYTYARFKIIPLRFLEEIEQYLPDTGTTVDLGCGFGLFSLYMAACKPNARIIGVDLNVQRLRLASHVAERLGIGNVSFLQGDLRDWRPDQRISGAYALDVFHHIPLEHGNELLKGLFSHLESGGRFLLKDIDTTPRSRFWFTYALDVLMSPHDDFCYRSVSAWKCQLAASGFAPIHMQYLWDILPYPHVLLICEKPNSNQKKEA